MTEVGKKKKRPEVNKMLACVCVCLQQRGGNYLFQKFQNIINFILFSYIRVVDHCGQRVQSPPANHVQEYNAIYSP